MTSSARAFGLSTGGYDRRLQSDRRKGERRTGRGSVADERRTTPNRRVRGRRITEWFPVRPRLFESTHGTPEQLDQHRGRAIPEREVARNAQLQDVRSSAEPPGKVQAFKYRHRTYIIEYDDSVDDRGQPTGRRWYVKRNGVVEHVLSALPNEDPMVRVSRAMEVIEQARADQPRELEVRLDGKLFRVEDWTGILNRHPGSKDAMWCVISGGVVVGSFTVPVDAPESVLQYRAAQVIRGGAPTLRPAQRTGSLGRSFRNRNRPGGRRTRLVVLIAAAAVAAWFVSIALLRVPLAPP